MEHSSPPLWSGLLARLDADATARRCVAANRRKIAEELARVLVDDFGVRRVWLFGSLARGGIGGKLDIDLAVEGLDETLELSAWSAVDARAGTRVDLVRLETASDRLRAVIRQEGVLLHERD